MGNQQEQIRRLRVDLEERIQEIEARLEETKHELQNAKNALAALVSSCKCPSATRQTIKQDQATYISSCPDCGKLSQIPF